MTKRCSKDRLIKMHLLILVVCCIFANLEIVNSQLSPNGANVCSRVTYYTTYYGQTRSMSNPVTYRTCCRRFLGICSSRCTRTRYEVKYYTAQISRTSSRRSYYCCTGWAKSGNGCPIAICNPGCRNGGTCYAPGACRCRSGFQGNRCEFAICNPGCRNGGTCYAPGACRCRSGFQGNRCEFDVKECSLRPPVCDQTCNELLGSYSCSCRRGYVKTVSNNAKDRRCSDVDECKTNPCTCAQSNDRNCVPICKNTVGSFGCACKPGYQLLNGRVCSDINECTTSRHNCAQTCSNTAGSFICSCKVGYRLLSDKRSCENINECARINGGCNQICQDTDGSYNCQCRSGYRLSNNRLTCFDINECTEQQPCDQNNGVCTNLPGLYRCSCKTGFQLNSDGKTCDALSSMDLSPFVNEYL